jgi:hypothetical protein
MTLVGPAVYCAAPACVEPSSGYVRLAYVEDAVPLCDEHLEPIRGALLTVMRPTSVRWVEVDLGRPGILRRMRRQLDGAVSRALDEG